MCEERLLWPKMFSANAIALQTEQSLLHEIMALPLKLSEVLMNFEFVPSLALNFGQCSISSRASNFLVSSGLSPVKI